jgi:DNA uptake protein ComE-like DNA-binding protein
MARFLSALFVMLWLGVSPAARTQSPPSSSAASAKESTAVRLIDINHASASELKSIPGIGEAYASKIMAGRPYKNKSQLKSHGILPGHVYERVKDSLVARQN